MLCANMTDETKSTKSRQSCCVVGCTNSYANSSEIHFYRFPSRRFPHQHERRETWIELVRRGRVDGTGVWEPKPHSRICSRHFIGNRKSEESNSPSYNPSIFTPVKVQESTGFKRFGKWQTNKLHSTTQAGQKGSNQISCGQSTPAPHFGASPSRRGCCNAPAHAVRHFGGSVFRSRGTQVCIRATDRGVQCKELEFSHNVGCQTTLPGGVEGTYSRKQRQQPQMEDAANEDVS